MLDTCGQENMCESGQTVESESITNKEKNKV